MADISLEAVTGKLNRVGYEAFIQALRRAKSAGNRNVELAHWLAQILLRPATDIGLTAQHYGLDMGRLATDIGGVEGFRKNETEMPGVSNSIVDGPRPRLALRDAVLRRDADPHRPRPGGDPEVERSAPRPDRHLEGVRQDQRRRARRRATAKIWETSEEENLRPMDGSGLRAAGTPGAEQAEGAKGTTALDRFSQDLTAKARTGRWTRSSAATTRSARSSTC
jgi:type VI secretion system protein VasG